VNRGLGIWIAFLVLWAGSLLWTGSVSEPAVPAVAAAVAGLYIASLFLLPEPTRLSRGSVVFLAALSALFLIQLLPLPFLFPHAAALRAAHGVGGMWPATADTFYTVRALAQAATYVLSGLLVIRLRQAGVSSSQIITGLVSVLALEAGYGLVQVFAGLKEVPFFGPRPSMDSASGTLVSRNNFAGLMAIGLVLSAVRAAGRFAWPMRTGADPGRPRWIRRAEGISVWVLATALFVMALVLSKSRGGALAAVGGLMLAPFFHRGRASAAGAVALMAVAACAAFVANPAGLLARFGAMDPFELSSEARWRIFTTTIQAAMHQPVLGFGWGTHPRAYHPFQPASLPGQVHHAHNEYMNVLFEAGFLGLALLLAGLVYWFVRAWRAQKPLPGPDRIPVTASFGAASVIALHSFVDFDLRITAVGIGWAALMGLGAAASRDGVSRTTWPVAAAALAAAAALFFLPLQPKFPEGEAQARRFLALSPYDQDSAWVLADATGDLDRLERAADLWPANANAQREAGLTFWERGDRARAAKCLRRQFEQQPYGVVEVLQEIWSKEHGLSDYEALLPDRPGARAVYAGELVKRGLWKDSMAAFERGVAGDDPANAIWFDYFAAQLQQAGQWGIEATVRDRRLSLKSSAWAHAASAEAWLKLGAYDRALERALTAQRVDPSNAAWPGLRGAILESKGDRMGAVEAFTSACALAPTELEWRLRRGFVELEEKTYAAAEKDFREVVRSRPQHRGAVLGLVRAQAGQGQTASARILLDDWLRRNPGDAEAAAFRAALPRK
jgi:tetratricopeptide (TPR) repeat protein/O-antigen ligase